MSTEELFGSDSENEDSQQKKDAENLKFARFESQEIFSEDDLLKSRPEPDIDSIYSSEEREIFTPQYSEDEEPATGVIVNESGYKLAPTQQDIFGEEIDVSSDEEESKQKDEVLDENVDGGYALDAGKEPGDEGVAIEIELPNVDESIGNDIYFVKLPNFLSIETKPFDPTFFEDEIDEDEVLDEEGRSRLKLKVENTIRWRNRKHDLQNDAKESNARIVRWSDGSLSLHMGNEIFDIFKMPIEGLQNHLFVQQGTGLQAKSVFKEKLTFRPHSTKSQTHLKMTMSIADRVSKSQKIRLIPVTDRDPEATRQEMTKKEDERMRAQLRRESQQRRMREKSHSKGLTANYLESEIYEDDEQELEESLAAIKSRYKKDVKAGRSRNVKEIYSDVDSDADEKLVKAKIDLSSEEEGPRGSKRKTPNKELTKRKRSTRKIIESDDDSE